MRPELLTNGWEHDEGRSPHNPPVHRQPEDLDHQVMEQLRASNRPLGAYEIARQSLQTKSPLAPNQVYRILDRLVERGAVRRVELLAAYLPARSDYGGFAVCRDCRMVTSFDGADVAERLTQLCRARDFVPAAHMVEVSGLCPECSARRADAATGRRSRGIAMLAALLSLASGPDPAGAPRIFEYPATVATDDQKLDRTLERARA